MSDHNVITLLSSKTAPVGGLGLVFLGTGLIVVGGLWGLFGEESLSAGLPLVLLALVFGGGLVRAGALLLLPKGGLSLVESAAGDGGAVLRLRGVGRDDGLCLPLSELSGLRLVPRDEEWDRHAVRIWSCELVVRDGPAVLVGESHDYEAVFSFARRLEGALVAAGAGDLALKEHSEWEPPASAMAAQGTGAQRYRVRQRGHLHETMAGTGIVAFIVGALLFARVTEAPVVGFLFGPILLFMGLALFLTALTGSLADDVVRWDGTSITRLKRLGPFTWGEKSIALQPAPYLRLRHRGLLGASLELVGPKQIAVLLTGVTARSEIDYEGLRAAGAALARIISAEKSSRC